MGNHSSSQASAETDVFNNILEESSSSCSASSTASSSGNIIVINNATVNGSFSAFNANAYGANASCIINNSLQSQISTIITDSLQQTSSSTTGILGTLLSFQTDHTYANVQQTVTNNVTEIMENTCQASSMSDSTANYLYFSGTINGNFSAADASSSTASASCTMNNYAKMIASNNLATNIKQSTKYSTTGVVLLIFIGIAIVVVAVGAVGIGVVYFTSGKKPQPQATQATLATQATQESQEHGTEMAMLKAASSLFSKGTS